MSLIELDPGIFILYLFYEMNTEYGDNFVSSQQKRKNLTNNYSRP